MSSGLIAANKAETSPMRQINVDVYSVLLVIIINISFPLSSIGGVLFENSFANLVQLSGTAEENSGSTEAPGTSAIRHQI